ncbi:MAG: hypothetical protein WED05_03475 [Candidatus Atabeyarchaeum deiterrae]
MMGLTERVELLFGRKKRIANEMAGLASAFGIDQGKLETGGCLRLEDVYCVKRGKRYGPYGPYYYLYFHRTEKMEKRYVGKRADRLKVRQEVNGKLRELEAEYKKILSVERRLAKALGMPAV